MSTTTYKHVSETKNYNSDVVIQITKQQLITFFSIVLVIAILCIDFIAITTKSELLEELLIVQGIMALVAFVKFSKSNSISKK